MCCVSFGLMSSHYSRHASLAPHDACWNACVDLQFSGKITSYTTTPVAIQGNQTAALNRLTITATVKFVNKIDEKKNFETTFTNFVDFSSSENFSSIENKLIEDVTTMMVQDIFNKAVINW